MISKMSLTIYNRLKLVFIKKRVFPIILIIQNLLMSLIVLIYANRIISDGKTIGELNYQFIKTFYTITIFILFILPVLYSPYFLAKSVNELVKNNITINLFSSKVKSINIVFPCFLCGFLSVLVLTFSILPIIIVSFYFGGISIYRFIIILIYLIFYIIFVSGISMYISTIIVEPNLSIVFVYIIDIILLFIHVLGLPYILNNRLLLITYSIIVMIIFLILMVFSKKTRLFSINT